MFIGEKCDWHGNIILPNASPESIPDSLNPWGPFEDEVAFWLADLLFKKVEMSRGDIDELINLWCLDIQQRFDLQSSGPFKNHEELLKTIDNIPSGSAPWQCLNTVVEENLSANAPEWQKVSYQVWYSNPDTVISNILANPDFENDFDTSPYVHLGKNGKRCLSDFMSANFAFRHAVSFPSTPPRLYLISSLD